MTISKKNMKWIPWLLILPVVLIRGFTTVYPILMTVKNSFFNISILAGINEFIGFKNYLKVFSDPKVLTSISFTAIFVVASMIFHVILGVILALILNMKFKGRRFLRTIVLIPWAMPAVVAGMAAKWAFNNDYGLINDFIRWFVPGYQNSWLINTGTARAAVIAMDLWKDLPFFAILVLSGLQFISGDIYEAAKVDGANGIQSFFRITLPLIAKKCPDFMYSVHTLETDNLRSGLFHDIWRPWRGYCADRIQNHNRSIYKSKRRICFGAGYAAVCCNGDLQLAEYTCYE